jgi:exodeoxyribonuclease-3
MVKVTTWNVNGFRAVLKKGFKESIELLEPDILCLQEIKAREDQISGEEIAIDDYAYLWNSAQQPGYSGVATYYKNNGSIINLSKGFGNPEFDVEGRVIRLDREDFILFNIYFPNGQRGQERVDYKLDFYSYLLDLCNELHKEGKNIVITGDFNTAHSEIDLANPKENSKTSGFLPEERAWIDKYLENGFVDAYRQLYPEKIEYTWWTYRFNARARGIGWRLDYFLVSESFLPRVSEIKVHNEILGSDHCPVTLYID